MSNRLRGRFPNRTVSNRLPSWVLTAGSVAASLDIDFVNDLAYNSSTTTIASLLTCTRAAPATTYYTNADGTLTGFAANTLRYGSNGLLVEESRTNLLVQSNTLSTSWSLSSASAAAQDGTLAPDGTSQLWKLAPNAATAVHEWYQSVTLASGTTHALSAIVKPGGKNFVQLMSQKTTNVYFTGVFDLSSTANTTASQTSVGSGSTLVSTSQVALANGCFLITIVGSHTSQANPFFVINPAPAATGNTFSSGGDISWTALATDTVYAGFCQLEAGSFATSYIPTTTGSVARSADNVTFGSVSWYSAIGGSFYTQLIPQTLAAEFPIFEFRSDGNNGHYQAVGGRAVYVVTSASAVADISPQFGLVSVGSTEKLATCVVANDFAACFNGGSVSTDASGALPVVTGGYIGYSLLSGGKYLNQYLRRFTYFPTRVGNTNLQTITT